MKGTITASSLNVRRGAGTTYSVVKTLKRNATVNIYESKKAGSSIWYRIGANQWVSSTYVKITDNKNEIVVNPKMTMKQIQDCLEESGCTIRFTSGIYNITRPLLIYSDTKIHLDNATLVRKNSKQMFINYLNPKISYNYNATKNVTFSGKGTLVGNGRNKICSTISLMHCNNITFEEGIEFSKTFKSHAVDISGCRDITFTRVKFKDRIDNPKALYKEEINIDLAYYSGYPYYPKGSKCYNDNHCENIIFDGCNFQNINTCIGSHVETSTLKKHKNITIKNCKATGCGEGIFVDLVNTEGATIENNNISGFKRGIVIDALDKYRNSKGNVLYSYPKGKTSCSNINISKNTISNAKGTVKASGIYIISQSDLRHKNINISSNNISLNNSNAKYDIYVEYADEVKCKNNKTKLDVVVK